MNIIKSKKQMFLVIGAFTLILLLGTASYAFFNYTRTGGTNQVGVGRIAFNTDQGNDTLTLSNIFPMTAGQASTANLDSVAVHITGDTTYDDGEEFEITLVNVTNTVNGKTIPINYTATYIATENKGIGTSSDSYFTSRGSSSNVYQFTSSGEVEEGKQILIGYIPKNGEVDGTLTIKAYIDSSKVVISDTLQDGAVEVTGYNNGYPNPGEGVTVLTTSEWNALQGANTIKFSVRGIANEGTWIPNPGSAPMTLSSVSGTITEGESETVTITPHDNGALSCTSSTANATCSISGTTLTINGVSAGSATITVTQTAGTSYSTSSTATYTATIESAVPTIESCPNCKFIYRTSSFYYGGASNPTASTVSTLSGVTTDYTTLNKKSFLGFTESGGKVDRAFACGIKQGEPNTGTVFCIEGALSDATGGNATTRAAVYASNKTLITGSTLWNDPDFTAGRCTDNGSNFNCSGSVYAGADVNGTVLVHDGGHYCYVLNNGFTYCSS